MRIVTWTDQHGWKHRSMVRDGDPDDVAPKGVPQDPPDLRQLDWEGVMRDLHNALVEQGVVDWLSWQQCNCGRQLIELVLKRRLISLFRAEPEVIDNGR